MRGTWSTRFKSHLRHSLVGGEPGSESHESGTGICDCVILNTVWSCISNKIVLSKKVCLDVFIHFCPMLLQTYDNNRRAVWTGIWGALNWAEGCVPGRDQEWKWAVLFTKGIPKVDWVNASFFLNQSSTFCGRTWATYKRWIQINHFSWHFKNTSGWQKVNVSNGIKGLKRPKLN